ncbi:peptidoglycan-binding domain-containing protein [Poseidonocella sedimentorum]|uniref:Putative peptidoglycan binding domain-containing protein n=1 Tax=Poseidonocella sedimentorum TaxID=871652 RepID=A0A1I6CWI7_9RHOB|nr:peptidoglycan-binding domain-containing protein [Poseidonocella sedimentorum]SFQ97447.1 Putative peptidoglycan binding domain-containing protein [Poseidonocella sedimentorum]
MRLATGWADIRAQAGRMRRKGEWKRLGRVRPAGRFDPGLVVVGATAAMIFGVLGWIFAMAENANGVFDPQPLVEVDDPRILADYRTGNTPFVDGVQHGELAVLGRSDGQIAYYDSTRELFADDTIPRDANLSSELSFLSSACEGELTGVCTSDVPLFAVTQAGGLARRSAGNWDVLLGDSSWEGPDGVPIEQEEVALWSASETGRWILASAGAKGLGLFDQRSGSWRAVSQSGTVQRPDHLVWSNGYFWIAGSHGLEAIAPSRPMDRRPVEAVTGAVLDIATSPDGKVWILQSLTCPGGQCLSILSGLTPTSFSHIVGETVVPASLSQQGIEHAVLQERQIVTLGAAGVHAYDPKNRNWTILESAPVSAYHVEAGGRIIRFATGPGYAEVVSAEITRRLLLPKPIIQLLPLPDGPVIALARGGAVYDVSGNDPRTIAFADPALPKDTEFVTGAFWKGEVILLGAEGALIHDPFARRYAFDPGAPPTGSFERDASLFASEAALWLVMPGSGRVFVASTSGDWPDRKLVFKHRATVPNGILNPHVTGSTLNFVDAGGRPLALQADGTAPAHPVFGAEIGSDFRPTAATVAGTALVFSDGHDLAHYDPQTRGWTGPMPGPYGGVVDLAVLGPELYALTGQAAVHALGETQWRAVVGGPAGAVLGLEELSDARASGDQVFLAGDGSVQAYDQAARGFRPVFKGGAGPVRLLDVESSLPLWLSNNRLFRGAKPLSLPEEAVRGVAVSGGEFAYLARNGRQDYVVFGEQERCLFRGTTSPAKALRDARNLPDGRLFVLTEDEAYIYEPAAHRWLDIDIGEMPEGARLEVLGEFLVLAGTDTFRAVPFANIPTPLSCDPEPLDLAWTSEFEVEQVVLDTARGDALLRYPRGRITRWRAGHQVELLPPVGPAPPSGTLRRVYDDSDALIFASDTAIWRYELTDRVWKLRQFFDAPPDPREVDLVRDNTGRQLVTLWDATGETWGGQPGEHGLHFSRLRLPPMPVVTQPPEDIIDMAVFDDGVAILGRREMELFDIGDFKPSGRIDLPEAQIGWQIMQVSGQDHLVLVDGAPETPKSIYVLDPERMRETGATLANSAFVYRPGDDRDWKIGAQEIFRIDRGLNVHICPITPGLGDADVCRIGFATPMRAKDIKALEKRSNGYIALLRDSVVRLDDNFRWTETMANVRVNADSRLINSDGRTYLWEGPDRRLLDVWEDEATALLDGVTSIESFRASISAIPELLAFTLDAIHVVRYGALTPLDAGASRVSAATLSRGGREVVWLDALGRLRSTQPLAIYDRALRFPASATAIMRLGQPSSEREGGAQWAYQTDEGRLEIVSTQRCESGSPIGPDLTRIEIAPMRVDISPCVHSLSLPLRLSQSEHLSEIMIDGTTGTIFVGTSEAKYEVDAVSMRVRRQRLGGITSADHESLSDVRSHVINVDGMDFLAPPAFQKNDELFQLKLGSKTSVTVGGVTGLPPLDQAWFDWDRSTGKVRFGRTVSLLPEQAFRDGLFLPAAPGKGALLPDGSFSYANANGIWRVSGNHVSPIVVAALPEVVGLSHGVFLFDKGGREAQSGLPVNDGNLRKINRGALTLSETLRPGGVDASYMISGQAVPAFAPHGFAFDRRLAAATEAGKPWLLTPIGLVPADDLDEGGVVAPGTRSLDTVSGQLFADIPSGWQSRRAEVWRQSAPPRETMELARDPGRIWRRVDGRAEVVPESDADTWRIMGNGLDFAAERPLAMSGEGAALVLVTGAGTHVSSSIAALGRLAAPVTSDPGVERLDTLQIAPDLPVTWGETPNGHLIWDNTHQRWRKPSDGENPWEARRAVASGSLRIEFGGTKAKAAFLTDTAGGAKHPVPFNWRRGGHLPFDLVRSVHAEDGKLLLATDFGLRRLALTEAGLEHEALFRLSPTGPQAAALRVGRSDLTGQLLGEVIDACVIFDDISAFPRPCDAAGGNLSRRHILRNDFWHWSKSDSAVFAEYVARDGTPLIPLPVAAGAPWLHDRLADRMLCEGRIFELWRGAPVAAEITAGVPGDLQMLPAARYLHCHTDTSHLGGGRTLGAGPYSAGGGSAWRWSSSGWTSEPEAAALAERAAGNVPWETQRLRLALRSGFPELSYLLEDGSAWRGIAWEVGRMPVDRIQGLAYDVGGMQVFTPAGLHGWDTQHVGFDPGQLTLRTPPDPQRFAECNPVWIEVRDGRTHGIPQEADHPISVVCTDGIGFLADPTKQIDLGSFTASDKAIPEDRVLVDTEVWRWTQHFGDTAPPEGIDIRFRDEAIALNAGRLSIDAYSGLATPFSETVEIVTEGAGWWRLPADDLGANRSLRGPRGAAPERVTSLRSDRRGGERALCVDGETTAVVDADDKVVRASECRRWSGADPFWTWWQSDTGAEAEGVSETGARIVRELVGGRFSDLVVTAAPRQDSRVAGRLLVPTMAGLLTLGNDGPVGLMASDRPVLLANGMDDRVAPIGLHATRDLVPPTCAALTEVLSKLDDGQRLLRVVETPASTALLTLETSDDRQQLLIDCANIDGALLWSQILDAEDRSRRAAMGGALQSGLLLISADQQRVRASDGAVSFDLPSVGRPVAQMASSDGRAALILTEQALFRLDGDRLLSDLARSEGATASPTGPFATGTNPQPKPISTTSPTVSQPAQANPGKQTGPMQISPSPDDAVVAAEPGISLGWEEVYSVQKVLKSLGYYDGELDGDLGPLSTAAIRDWQRNERLEVTGELTQRQLDRLLRDDK